GSRTISALFCLGNATSEEDYRRWLKRVFDNRDHTFHTSDRDGIMGEIEKRTPANFVQDYVAYDL
ncbi:hypothetical protein PFISCL1PPCAC_3744, partial [Pristionchus fissidentatus]